MPEVEMWAGDFIKGDFIKDVGGGFYFKVVNFVWEVRGVRRDGENVLETVWRKVVDAVWGKVVDAVWGDVEKDVVGNIVRMRGMWDLFGMSVGNSEKLRTFASKKFTPSDKEILFPITEKSYSL